MVGNFKEDNFLEDKSMLLGSTTKSRQKRRDMIFFPMSDFGLEFLALFSPIS